MNEDKKVGGRRPGAGRHKLPEGERKVKFGTRLSPKVVEFLRSHPNSARWLDEVIRELPVFQEFVVRRSMWEKQS